MYNQIWPPCSDVIAIINNAKKCHPAGIHSQEKSPKWFISKDDMWNVCGVFVYKKGGGIFDICARRDVLWSSQHLRLCIQEHGILLARLQWDSPANAAYFSLSIILCWLWWCSRDQVLTWKKDTWWWWNNYIMNEFVIIVEVIIK